MTQTLDRYRSASDNGRYPEFCALAARDPEAFAHFKRHPVYRETLEHVTEDLGAAYLEWIRRESPELIRDIERFKLNDAVGDPVVCSYSGIGKISPTTLRYAKVAGELQKLFGNLDGMHVAEIGGGYGGQFLLADMAWHLDSWTFFDLDPVLDLARRYLECHLTSASYAVTNRFRGDKHFDLLISNYAFSELAPPVQEAYIRKLVCIPRGYVTMNTGSPTRQLLSSAFPGSQFVDEVPLTAPNNYVFVWGAK